MILFHPSVVLSSEEEEEGQDDGDGDGGKLQSSGRAEESGNSEQIQVGETPETESLLEFPRAAVPNLTTTKKS